MDLGATYFSKVLHGHPSMAETVTIISIRRSLRGPLVLFNPTRSHPPACQSGTEGVASFEGETNVAMKLLILSSEFDVSAEGSKYVPGFSTARTALTHNLGRVGERHLRHGELKISWKALDFLFNGKVADESDFNVPRPTDTNVSVMPVERVCGV